MYPTAKNKKWKNGLTTYLLLCFGVISIQSCQNGQVKIVGITTIGSPPNALQTVNISSFNAMAGYINMCYGEQWRAICHDQWDDNDARVVCRQLHFTGARSCTGSCLDKNNNLNGLINFRCSGNETRLNMCSYSDQTSRWKNRCGNSNHAGVLCYNSTNCTAVCNAQNMSSTTTTSANTPTTAETTPTTATTMPTTTPTTTKATTTAKTTPTTTTTTTSTSTTARTNGPTDRRSATTISSPVATGLRGNESAFHNCDRRENCVAESTTLGGLVAILLLALVIVTAGWVWSCHRNKEKGTLEKRSHLPNTMNRNPSYTQTSLIPAVQYSSTGPHSPTPTSHAPLESGIYHILEQPEKEGKEEGGDEGVYQDVESGESVYHMLGEAGEGQEEGVYHMLGEDVQGEEQEDVYHMLGEAEEGQEDGGEMVYEVPVQTKSIDAEELEKAYSTLHHN